MMMSYAEILKEMQANKPEGKDIRYNMIAMAVMKQVPREVMRINAGERVIGACACGNIVKGGQNYCSTCGNALKWSKE